MSQNNNTRVDDETVPNQQTNNNISGVILTEIIRILIGTFTALFVLSLILVIPVLSIETTHENGGIIIAGMIITSVFYGILTRKSRMNTATSPERFWSRVNHEFSVNDRFHSTANDEWKVAKRMVDVDTGKLQYEVERISDLAGSASRVVTEEELNDKFTVINGNTSNKTDNTDT